MLENSNFLKSKYYFYFTVTYAKIYTKYKLNDHTVDSKIDENRCKQKYVLIQVMGYLYNKAILNTVSLHEYNRGKLLHFISHIRHIVLVVWCSGFW